MTSTRAVSSTTVRVIADRTGGPEPFWQIGERSQHLGTDLAQSRRSIATV
jgi:hypothetical protein